MFERFTTAARETVVSAQARARDLGQRTVGPEHLLLGVLTTAGTGQRVLLGAGADAAAVTAHVARRAAPDAEALAALGVDLEEVRRRAEATFGPGALDAAPPPRRGFLSRRLGLDHVPFEPAARQVLTDSLTAALSLHHRRIGTEHLLLALLGDEDGPAVAALRATGVALDRAAATDLVLAGLRDSA